MFFYRSFMPGTSRGSSRFIAAVTSVDWTALATRDTRLAGTAEKLNQTGREGKAAAAVAVRRGGAAAAAGARRRGGDRRGAR